MFDQTNQQNATTTSIDHKESQTTKTTSLVKAKALNVVITGKGGIGKSYIASLLMQYLQEIGAPVLGIDIDPCQASLATTTGLNAEAVDLLDGERINVQVMDACITRIIEEDTNFVLDVGAAGFVAFLSYVLRDKLFDVIMDEGKRVVVHAVVVGGPQMVETVLSLKDMIRQLPARCEFCLWMNPFFGPLTAADGRPFEGGPWWDANKGRLSATVRIPVADPHYNGGTVSKILAAKKTFGDALAGDDLDRIAKLRLRRYWDELKTQIWAAV